MNIIHSETDYESCLLPKKDESTSPHARQQAGCFHLVNTRARVSLRVFDDKNDGENDNQHDQESDTFERPCTA
jgi:hypothetical protein